MDNKGKEERGMGCGSLIEVISYPSRDDGDITEATMKHKYVSVAPSLPLDL
jgi:hypothetical protein